MSENALAKLGDLTKPATVLIEKISDAVGGVFKPFQIVRVARAEAEADQIRTESQIHITDLHRRAMHRFFEEEAKRQSNIEGITQKALPLLEENSSPQNVENDWITNFFDKCRIISDEEMQKLWSRVLAGEANAPGAFSKQSVNLLADLDKSDAESFTRLCAFVWIIEDIEDVVPLVLDYNDSFYKNHKINFSMLSHLESLGLIHLSPLREFQLTGLPKKIIASYYGRAVEITFPNDTDNALDIGRVFLTRAGTELARVCGSAPVDGVVDFVCARWAIKYLASEKTTGSPAHAAG